MVIEARGTNSAELICTICARGGSKGIKDKNILPLSGKPLIAYSIEQAVRWGKADHIIVSTDSKRIADIAEDFGAEIIFTRPAELAGDNVGKLEVLRHALKEAELYYKISFGALLDLDATAPVRTIEDIDNVIALFRENKADCVFSAIRARRNPYFNMVEKQIDGTAALCKQPPTAILNRQSAPLVYEMNASIFIYSSNFLLDARNKTPYAKNAYVYEMKDTAAIDIDSEIDFKFLEFLMKEGIVKL